MKVTYNPLMGHIDEMHDRNQQPNKITYDCLLDASCKIYHIDKAFEL